MRSKDLLAEFKSLCNDVEAKSSKLFNKLPFRTITTNLSKKLDESFFDQSDILLAVEILNEIMGAHKLILDLFSNNFSNMNYLFYQYGLYDGVKDLSGEPVKQYEETILDGDHCLAQSRHGRFLTSPHDGITHKDWDRLVTQIRGIQDFLKDCRDFYINYKGRNSNKTPKFADIPVYMSFFNDIQYTNENISQFKEKLIEYNSLFEYSTLGSRFLSSLNKNKFFLKGLLDDKDLYDKYAKILYEQQHATSQFTSNFDDIYHLFYRHVFSLERFVRTPSPVTDCETDDSSSNASPSNASLNDKEESIPSILSSSPATLYHFHDSLEDGMSKEEQQYQKECMPMPCTIS